MVQEPKGIIHLSEARRALAKANTIDEVKQIRDKAVAVRMYAKAQGLGLDTQNAAAEIKIRAERKAGELLRDMKASGLRHSGRGDQKSGGQRVTPKLSDIGIEKKQSERWQRVASVSEAEFEKHLATTKAERDELTTSGVLSLAKTREKKKRQDGVARAARVAAPATVISLQSLIDSGQKFSTIAADPPWKYGNQVTRASTRNHYGTMTVEEIAALPVGELADDECHLWLWTTNGFLFECPKLFDAWGFEFKSSYIWCKDKIGIGNYLRNSHEFLLLAAKGGLTGAAKDVRSWGEYPRGEHSAKPERIYEKVIERVSPGPRLEMFGRKTRPGWTVWGNQVRKGLFDVANGI